MRATLVPARFAKAATEVEHLAKRLIVHKRVTLG